MIIIRKFFKNKTFKDYRYSYASYLSILGKVKESSLKDDLRYMIIEYRKENKRITIVQNGVITDTYFA